MDAADRSFAYAFAFVLGREGGFVDRPSSEDPGGATNHGVSLRYALSKGRLLDKDMDGDVDADDIRLITVEDAQKLYRADFWDATRAGEMPPAVALVVFDTAVNCGAQAARILLQKALGVVADGMLGPRSMAALKAADPIPLCIEILARRTVLQASLSNWGSNALGWSRRLMLLNSSATWLAHQGTLA